MRQRENEFNELGIQVVVVTFQSGPLVAAYARETDLSWPILADPDLELYRAYSMEHGKAWDVYGPAAVWSYVKLMSRGRKPKPPAGDVTQLGGDVLVDPSGIVRMHYVGKGPADRPSVDSILDVVSL